MDTFLSLIGLLLNVFQLILLARVLLSWFPQVDRYNPIVRFIYEVTEPVLAPIRQFVGPMGGLDISPLVVIIIIFAIQTVLRI
ncbi:MAG: YggT family protein [Chloroflexi bacterium]|jgi:YggT family protein|nr:MAG: protein of unknown function YGGT [Chloroflexi bacterium OLB13]MBC6955143.1 YggT family protein [Chloroflexota bacterium]MBV6436079.1 hypothetical protein [Anaerolineae bacterium]MDL1914871.1 YggT family protein [Anaerolineae bacterium CFX4]OQY80356.1 MAG: hypothetical protein B6D42_13235 [Anaerolineae bacterium UTCFX5]